MTRLESSSDSEESLGTRLARRRLQESDSSSESNANSGHPGGNGEHSGSESYPSPDPSRSPSPKAARPAQDQRKRGDRVQPPSLSHTGKGVPEVAGSSGSDTQLRSRRSSRETRRSAAAPVVKEVPQKPIAKRTRKRYAFDSTSSSSESATEKSSSTQAPEVRETPESRCPSQKSTNASSQSSQKSSKEPSKKPSKTSSGSSNVSSASGKLAKGRRGGRSEAHGKMQEDDHSSGSDRSDSSESEQQNDHPSQRKLGTARPGKSGSEKKAKHHEANADPDQGRSKSSKPPTKTAKLEEEAPKKKSTRQCEARSSDKGPQQAAGSSGEQGQPSKRALPSDEVEAHEEPKPTQFKDGAKVRVTQDFSFETKAGVKVRCSIGDEVTIVRTTGQGMIWALLAGDKEKKLIPRAMALFLEEVKARPAASAAKTERPPRCVNEACRASLPSTSAKFCAECGTAQEGRRPPEAEEEEEMQAPETSTATSKTETKSRQPINSDSEVLDSDSDTCEPTTSTRNPENVQGKPQQPARRRPRVDLLQVRDYGHEAEITLKQLEGKLVTFVMGKTGVGKSTLMQWLAGAQLCRGVYNGREVFEVKRKGNANFEIGHETKSKTKVIKQLALWSDRMKEEVCYCDSAGFGDSAGVEMDIATSLSMRRVGEVAKSLRFLVLVSYTSFVDSRGGGARSFLSLIGNLVCDWKRHRYAFTFVFTHTESLSPADKELGTVERRKKEAKALRKSLKELRDKTEGEMSSAAGDDVASVKEVLAWILEGLKNSRDDLAMIFHPEDTNVLEVRGKMEDFTFDSDGQPHALGLQDEPPSKVLRCGLSMEILSKLALEVRELSERVDGHLRCNELPELLKNLELLAFVQKHMKDARDVAEGVGKVLTRLEGYVRNLLDKAFKVMLEGTVPKPTAYEDRLTADSASMVFQHFGLALGVSQTLDSSGLDTIEKSKAQEAFQKLESRLQEMVTDLSASTSPLGIPELESSRNSQSQSSLVMPLPEGTFYRLECLLLWSEAASKPSNDCDCHHLAAIRDAAKQGANLATGYTDRLEELYKLSRVQDTETRVPLLARKTQLGQWLAQLPESSKNHFDESVLTEQAGTTTSLFAELEAQASNLSIATSSAIKNCTELLGATPEGEVGSMCQKPCVQEAFGTVARKATDLLQFGEFVKRDEESLGALADAFQRGLLGVEQEATSSLHLLQTAAQSSLSSAPELGPMPPRVQGVLEALRTLVRSALRGAEGGSEGQRLKGADSGEVILAQLCMAVSTKTKEWQTKLDSLWNEGKPAAGTFEKQSLDQQLQLLTAIVETSWLDGMSAGSGGSPEAAGTDGPAGLDKTSIAEVSQYLKKRYSEYVAQSSQKVTSLFQAFLEAPSSFGRLDEMSSVFAERDHLKAFSQILPNISEDDTSLANELCRHLNSWKEKQLRSPYEPDSTSPGSVFKSESLFAQELEDFFLVWAALEKIPGSRALVLAEHKQAEERLEWLKKSVQSVQLLRGREGHFQEKKQLLDALSAWSGRFARLCTELPTSESLLDELRQEVAQESDHLAKVIQRGEFDLADKLLTSLRDASCLDAEQYLNGFAKSEIDKLTQSLELKRLAFGEELDRQIEECDFEAAEDQLRTILESEALKGRAEDLFKQIGTRIERLFTDADANDGAKVSEHLMLLFRASNSLTTFRSHLPNVNFEWYIESLKTNMNNAFDTLVAKFRAELSASEVHASEVLEKQRLVIQFHNAAKSFLAKKSCDAAKEVLASAGKCLESMDILVERFLKNLQVEPQDRTDISELLEKLKELKQLILTDPAPAAAAEAEDLALQPDSNLMIVVRGSPGQDSILVTDKEGKKTRVNKSLRVGAIVRVLQRTEARAEFQLVDGVGPSAGWIPTMEKGKEVLWCASEVHKVCSDRPVATRGTEKQRGSVLSALAAFTSSESLAPGTFVRLLNLSEGCVQFERLSDHKGPVQGWADECSGPCKIFQEVLQTGAFQGDLKPAISLPAVSNVYTKSVKKLSESLDNLPHTYPLSEGDPAAVAQATTIYKYLLGEFNNGLAEHLEINVNIKEQLEKAEEIQKARVAGLEKTTLEDLEKTWAPMLNSWGLSFRETMGLSTGSYAGEIQRCIEQAARVQQVAIGTLGCMGLDYHECGLRCQVVLRMKVLLVPHAIARTDIERIVQELQDKLLKHGEELCDNLCKALQNDHVSQFEMLLLQHYKFIRMVKASDPDSQLLAKLPDTHALWAQHFKQKCENLDKAFEAPDLQLIARQVETLRKFGQVLSGVFALYSDLVATEEDTDDGLKQLCELNREKFSGKAFVEHARHYVRLELTPNAGEEEIQSAYERLTKQQEGQAGGDEEQRQLDAARLALLRSSARGTYQQSAKEYFAKEIQGVPSRMRTAVEEKLKRGDYEAAKRFLNSSLELPKIAQLVEPALDAKADQEALHRVFQEHFDQLSNGVSKAWDDQDLGKVNELSDKLGKAQEAFGGYDVFASTKDWYPKLRKEVKQKIDEDEFRILRFVASAKATEILPKIANELLKLGRIMDEVERFKDTAQYSIDTILDQIQEEMSPTFIWNLGNFLQQGKAGKKDQEGNASDDDKRVAASIVTTFRQFQEIRTRIWNQQTATQMNVETLLKQIKPWEVAADGSQTPQTPNCDLLQEGVEQYNATFERNWLGYTAKELTPEQLVSNTRELCEQFSGCSVKEWSQPLRKVLPEILANIGSYFTISKSGASYQKLASRLDASQEGASEEAKDVLQRPHPIQILTLLRMFGFDSDSTSLRRQLMQIRTGEGKSMILGMSSLLFALLGFRVRCVCYSEYLSQRDFTLFRDMFEAFGVLERVTYSKITRFSEDKVAERGDIRQLTEDLLTGNLQAAPSTSAEAVREEILLLDEVDMFFGEDFYGKTHNQVAPMNLPQGQALLKAIWAKRYLPREQLYQEVLQSSEYQELKTLLGNFPAVLDREVRQMCSDVGKVDSKENEYVVEGSKNRIGYKEMDGISYNIVKGYMTAFAYLQMSEQGRFSDKDAALAHGLRFRVSCGQFCYNKIEPACIMGVSGTLASLGKDEWEIMGKYDIDCYTMMPSVYGQGGVSFLGQEGDITAIEVTPNRSEQFRLITDYVQKLRQKKRAVIVIFENGQILGEFEGSDYSSQIESKIILAEQDSSDTKDFKIKKAATAGQVTLTTAVFGRGTDFMCNDDRVKQAGGVHIIQAFVSLDKCEEEQIMGRTGRQGNKGSYSMVLCEPDLGQRFGLQLADLDTLNSVDKYKLLEEKREELRHTKFERIHEELAVSQERDDLTRKYFDALLQGDSVAAKGFFEELFKKIVPQTGGGAIQAVFCLDNSGSMSGGAWKELQAAFSAFLTARQGSGDLISVVIFNHGSRIKMKLVDVATAQATPLDFQSGGTNFLPALEHAKEIFQEGLQHPNGASLSPVLVFMSDGVNGDGDCLDAMKTLAKDTPGLQAFTVFFGTSSGASRLKMMAEAIPRGQYRLSTDGIALQQTFEEIATQTEYTR